MLASKSTSWGKKKSPMCILMCDDLLSSIVLHAGLNEIDS